MLQLLQQYEHLATHLAQAVELIVNTFGVKGIVSEIMRYNYRVALYCVNIACHLVNVKLVLVHDMWLTWLII